MSSTFTRVREQYLPTDRATTLHTVDIWLRHGESIAENKGSWIVFIHGGAWRDPTNTSLDFLPAVERLSISPKARSIAGFASINYRLSSYSMHPINPSLPDDPSRNAVYPDHVYDVSRALSYLGNRFCMGDYLLVGHSAGATIALQVLLQQPEFSVTVPVPGGILGVEGIYDLPALIKSFEGIPVYQEIVRNAFGDDASLWRCASPTSMCRVNGWRLPTNVFIAHSDEDELVDRKQAELMFQCVRNSPNITARARFLQAFGNHENIVDGGSELVRLIEETFEVV